MKAEHKNPNSNVQRLAAMLWTCLAFHPGASTWAQLVPQFVWVQQAGAHPEATGRGIAVDTEGNIYAAGYFGGTVLFGPTTLTSAGYTDFFLTKYDAAGNVVWARQAGGRGEYHALDVAVDQEGNAYVMGRFCCRTVAFANTNLTAAEVPGEPGDTFLAKYDNAGNFLWAVNHKSLRIKTRVPPGLSGVVAIAAGCKAYFSATAKVWRPVESWDSATLRQGRVCSRRLSSLALR